jgi:hypothetical protein
MLSVLAFGLLAHGSGQQAASGDNDALATQVQSQEAPATEPQPATPDQTLTGPVSPDSGNTPQGPTAVPNDLPQYEPSPQQADSPAPNTETPAAVAVQPASTSETGSGLGLSAFMIYCIAVIFIFYWLPAINGFQRKHRNAVPILLVNFFFGWTFIGWVVALIWSASDNVPASA